MSSIALIILVSIIVFGFTLCCLGIIFFALRVLAHVKDTELQKKSNNIQEYREYKRIINLPVEQTSTPEVVTTDEFPDLPDNESEPQFISINDLDYDDFQTLERQRLGIN